MNTYADSLRLNSYSIYYLKEPIYWLGSRVLFDAVESEVFVFVCFDMIVFFLIFYSMKIINLPYYFLLLSLLFFPSVMGMQNVLRQFIASGFLFVFVSLIFTNAKSKYKYLFLIVAGLTHNSAFLFSPLIFLNKSSRKHNILFSFSAIAVIGLLPLAAGTKSSSNTGDLPPYLYFIIYTLLIFSYLCILKFSFKAREAIFKEYFSMLIYLWSLILISMLVMGGAQSKRLGMLSLLLSLIPLTALIEFRFKQKVLVRLLFIIILVLPTMVFNNSKVFLQTSLLKISD